MKYVFIVFSLILFTSNLLSQDLVKIWEGKPNQKITGIPPGGALGLKASSLSDYNKDGKSDIVTTNKDLTVMFIFDGKTRTLLDSIEIDVGRSLCNNEVIEGIHSSFMDIDPNNLTKTAVISRKVSRAFQGTRSDNRVVMSGGSTMLSYPCDYQLNGFLDRDGDGHYIITMTNLTTNKPEIWAMP